MLLSALSFPELRMLRQMITYISQNYAGTLGSSLHYIELVEHGKFMHTECLLNRDNRLIETHESPIDRCSAWKGLAT